MKLTTSILINIEIFFLQGTEMVEAIFLDANEYTNMNLSPKTFEKMVNLRLLAIRDQTRCVNLPHGLDLLPENLRYFLWHGYPLKSLPPTFCPKMLVELSLKLSDAEKLWNGVVVCILYLFIIIQNILIIIVYFSKENSIL
jgi:hypothetical protein